MLHETVKPSATITASTRRSFRVVTEGSVHRLELWTWTGGWFVADRFADAATAEIAGAEFVASGRIVRARDVALTDVIELGVGRIAA